MDSGAPTSIGVLQSAAALCDVLGISLALKPPEQRFMHGWGPGMLQAKPVCCAWELPVRQVDGNPETFLFHLVEGHDPLVVGEDVTSKAKIDNIYNLLHVKNSDNSFMTFHTYLSPGELRRHLSVVPPPVPKAKEDPSNISSFLSATAQHVLKIGPTKIASRLHQY